MYVETFPDGRHSFPRFTPRQPRGPSAWTTTLQYVRAHRGEFAYEDHGTPWSVVTRNLDVTVARPDTEYRGQATFSNGTVAIQNYVPFRADMSTTFRIDGGKVRARPHRPDDRRRADRCSPARSTWRTGPSSCIT